MRKLFLAATGIFWLAVMVFAVAGTTAVPSSALVNKSAVALRHFTLTEVARHAVETDCWMAIDGAVYNLTAYLPDHPSRPSIILPWCGKEASEAYKTKTKGRPHSPEATTLLATYRIGLLDKP